MGEGDRGEGQSVVGTKRPPKNNRVGRRRARDCVGRDPLAQGVRGYGGGTDAMCEGP